MSRTIRGDRIERERYIADRSPKIRAEKSDKTDSPIAYLASSITYNLSPRDLDRHYWNYLKQKEKRRMHWMKQYSSNHAFV
jgi:hypothetical protein